MTAQIRADDTLKAALRELQGGRTLKKLDPALVSDRSNTFSPLRHVETDDSRATLEKSLNDHGRSILARSRFQDLDAIVEHPTTGAKCFIGNISAAQNKDELLERGITRVVNCQGSRTRNYHETDERFLYLRFPVAERFPGGMYEPLSKLHKAPKLESLPEEAREMIAERPTLEPYVKLLSLGEPSRALQYRISSEFGDAELAKRFIKLIGPSVAAAVQHLPRRYGDNEEVVAYFETLFSFVDSALAEGHSVLIHCMAGAHRAGTSGVAYYMHANSSTDVSACIKAVQSLRPVVDPYGRLRTLLDSLSQRPTGVSPPPAVSILPSDVAPSDAPTAPEPSKGAPGAARDDEADSGFDWACVDAKAQGGLDA